jgi:hypothetical protein
MVHALPLGRKAKQPSQFERTISELPASLRHAFELDKVLDDLGGKGWVTAALEDRSLSRHDAHQAAGQPRGGRLRNSTPASRSSVR